MLDLADSLTTAVADTTRAWRFAPGPEEALPGDGWVTRRRTMALIILGATLFGGWLASHLRRRRRR